MKNRELTNGVFIGIVKDAHDFVEDILTDDANKYLETVKAIRTNLELLEKLEERILQKKCIDTLDDSKIKLSILRNSYVYARYPFYRKNKKSKDIRVIVSKVPFNANGVSKIDDLYSNERIMRRAKAALTGAMMKSLYTKKSFV